MSTHPLNEMAERIRAINAENGWNITKEGDWEESDYKVPAILALIHSEVTEALEAFRNNDRNNFGEELADVVIRVLDAAPGLGIDIGAEVEAKLERNAKRGFRHGGKRV